MLFFVNCKVLYFRTLQTVSFPLTPTINERSSQHCSLSSLPHRRQPISGMFSCNKIYEHNLTCHTHPALLVHPTASVYKTDHVCHPQQQLHCSHPQHNSLSIHINMHYTPSTIHPTAFHNHRMHTTNKQTARQAKQPKMQGW